MFGIQDNNNMILVTGFDNRARAKNASMLSGILLDSILENDFCKDVFKAFVASNRVYEIICELPKPVGGIGSTSAGSISMSESKLIGTVVYPVLGDEKEFDRIISSIASNRIGLITVSDVSNIRFPALLSTDRPVPLATTTVVVAMEIERISDIPEVEAFLKQELRPDPRFNRALREGEMFPTTCSSGKKKLQSAIELRRRVRGSEFEAVIYHEDGAERPSVGDTLERRITVRNFIRRPALANAGPELEFSKRLGRIIRDR